MPCYVTDLQHMALLTLEIVQIVKEEQWTGAEMSAFKKIHTFLLPKWAARLLPPTFLLANQNPLCWLPDINQNVPRAV